MASQKGSLLAWLDRMSWGMLGIMAVLLGLAPFQPEPHLVEKIRMLSQGTLSRPIDIFDLFLHSAPLVLLALKALRQNQVQQDGGENPGS